jgi:serine/threonine-protein kinase
VQHPNVVATLDVVPADGEVLIVLEYVHGESFWHLLAASEQRGLRAPSDIVSAIVMNALHGLQAAHDAYDEHGQPLGLVHRDVSPQNLLVGVDGIARVLDFGVAKAGGRLQSTQGGQLKGKLAYMAPEQVNGQEVDCRTDVYAAAAMLWGALTGQRLVQGRHEGELLAKVMQGGFAAPSTVASGITRALDAVVMKGITYKPEDRFQSAREMALALEAACPPASPFEVSEWVKAMGAEALALRAARVREMESRSDVRVTLETTGAVVVESPFVGGQYDPNQSGVSGVLPGGTRVLDKPGGYPRAPDDQGPPSKLTPPPLPQQQAVAAPPWPPEAYPTQPQPQTLALGVPQPLYGTPIAPQPPRAHPSQSGSHPSHPSYPGAHPSHSGSGVAPPPGTLSQEHDTGGGARLVLIGLLSVVVTSLLVVAGYMYYANRVETAARVAPPPTSASASAPAPSDVSVPTATLPPPSATPDPIASAAPAPTPSAAPIASARPIVPSATARPSSGGGRRTSGSKKANCDNPFYVDAEGIKQIRPECQ